MMTVQEWIDGFIEYLRQEDALRDGTAEMTAERLSVVLMALHGYSNQLSNAATNQCRQCKSHLFPGQTVCPQCGTKNLHLWASKVSAETD